MTEIEKKVSIRDGKEYPYEVITPPNDLSKKVKVLKGRAAEEFDPIKRAEEALGRLSVSFDHWIEDEVDTLLEKWTAAKESQLAEEQFDEFFRASHDLKGQAATFGYPLIGDTAASLCDLIEHAGAENLPVPLAEQHVMAARAILREGDQKTGAKLVKGLQLVTQEFTATLPAKEDDSK